MAAERIRALFSEEKRAEILELTSHVKPICWLGGLSGFVIAGCGYLIVRNTGLILGLCGYTTMILGGALAIVSHDGWRASDNAQTLVQANPLLRGQAALSSQVLTDTLVKDCLVLPVFKYQIKQGIDKA